MGSSASHESAPSQGVPIFLQKETSSAYEWMASEPAETAEEAADRVAALVSVPCSPYEWLSLDVIQEDHAGEQQEEQEEEEEEDDEENEEVASVEVSEDHDDDSCSEVDESGDEEDEDEDEHEVEGMASTPSSDGEIDIERDVRRRGDSAEAISWSVAGGPSDVVIEDGAEVTVSWAVAPRPKLSDASADGIEEAVSLAMLPKRRVTLSDASTACTCVEELAAKRKGDSSRASSRDEEEGGSNEFVTKQILSDALQALIAMPSNGG